MGFVPSLKETPTFATQAAIESNEVTFDVDSNGILSVCAVDKATRQDRMVFYTQLLVLIFCISCASEVGRQTTWTGDAEEKQVTISGSSTLAPVA